MLFALIYKYLPDTEVPWRDVGIGAGITALLFVISKFLIGLYLAKSSMGSAYGPAGSLVLLLAWIYYASLVFLFGAECAAVYAHRHGSRAATTAEGRCAGDETPPLHEPQSGALPVASQGSRS